MDPFITIGIASYNYARFLPKAFEMIKKQSFTDYEILYCDDGSTDQSIEVIESIIKNNPSLNIRLVTGTNEGVISNKKRIIDHAKGKYIMICDADDWMDQNCLELLAAAAKRSDADRVIGQYRIVDNQGNTLRICDLGKPSSKWLNTLWHGCLFKREIFEKYPISIDKNFASDDYYMIMHYNRYCKNVEYIYDTVYNNLSHGENATTVRSINGSWKPKENFLQVLYYTYSIYLTLTNDFDKQMVEYQVTKFYFQALLTCSHVSSYQDLKDLYYELKNEMKDKFQYYPNNEYIKFTKENFDRAYGRKGIYLMSKLEKAHLLLPVLRLYNTLGLSLVIKGRI